MTPIDRAARERATCRDCGRELDGDAYCYGGRAFVPRAPGSHAPSKEAKINYYGGFVCSEACDYRASLSLEQSMPGHGYQQQRLGSDAQRSLERNWRNA